VIKALPYMASGLLVAAVWWLWSENASKNAEIERLAGDLRAAEMVAAQALEARNVARAETERYLAAAEEYAALKETIMRGNYEDVFLPDWFRAYLGRLFTGP
jgi:regulator of protease activity HflC (stomatin/prohibitin superfamily)